MEEERVPVHRELRCYKCATPLPDDGKVRYRPRPRMCKKCVEQGRTRDKSRRLGHRLRSLVSHHFGSGQSFINKYGSSYGKICQRSLERWNSVSAKSQMGDDADLHLLFVTIPTSIDELDELDLVPLTQKEALYCAHLKGEARRLYFPQEMYDRIAAWKAERDAGPAAQPAEKRNRVEEEEDDDN